MSKTWEKLFYFLSWVFQGSSYLSPRAYGIMHRQHHAYADTELDPHSPKYSKNIWDMMWKTRLNYNKINYNKGPELDKSFTLNVPEWDFIDKLGDHWFIRLSWVVFYAWVYYMLDAPIWVYFVLLPINIIMGPFHGAIINWFAHIYGYTNHKVNDTSKNLLFFDFLMWGESYHNNHHKNATSANFGEKWYEIDPLYIFVRMFDFLGIVKLKRS
jgi:stearoyl-CoA desaturase (delta-9 desaturase)